MNHRPDATGSVLAVLICLACLGLAEPRRAWAQGFDRPSGPLHKSRSSVMARHGMAATSQPLATAAAIRILQQGGNAVDAAIAANAVIGVVEPMSCGIGGDLFAIVWDARTGKSVRPECQRPIAGRRDDRILQIEGLDEDPHARPPELVGSGLRRRLGSASSTVRHALMGRVAGAGDRLRRSGLPRQRDHRPRLEGRREVDARIPTSAACYLPGGHAPEAGTIFRNPGLARIAAPIAREGRDAFYKGPLADAIVRYSQSVRAGCSAMATSPSTAVRASTLSRRTTADMTSGNCLPTARESPRSQMLNLLEPYDLKAMGPQSAEALHLMIEAKKLAYEDRAKYYADPEFANVPVAELISKDYAAKRRGLMNCGAREPAPGRGRAAAGRHHLHDGRRPATSTASA